MGPGRLFEGSPETMLASLDAAVSLGEDTLLWPGERHPPQNPLPHPQTTRSHRWEAGGAMLRVPPPGHEYALECLSFASLLELDNPALEQKLLWATKQRWEKRSTVSTEGGGTP